MVYNATLRGDIMADKKMTSIGGQAVIEGVMMRGPHKMAVAVRKPDGEIIIDEKPTKKYGIWTKIPIIRGVFSFITSMVIGIQALTFSASFFDVEETEEEKKKREEKEKKNKKNAKEDKKEQAKEQEAVSENKQETKQETNGMPGWLIACSVAISIALSVGLFIVLPNLISNFAVPHREQNPILYNFIESVVKIAIFLGYLALVSKMKDIRRVFEYHGAEHKTIFCYENGEELTVENVKKYSRFHPRCGTSFLLFVMIVSIIVFSLVGVYQNPLINLGLRLLLLPLVAGISYEIIKFAGRSKNKCITWLNEPGKWLQRLTTREPDASQIEVAIASLKAVIPENKDDDLW